MSDETKSDLPATTEDSSNTALDAVTEDTAGTDIDTVADLVSSLSLPTWIARNASKAFRQLCSAAVEWPSAFFRGKASERQAITEANTKITETVTDQIIQQINVPPEYAQIAVGKHIEKIIGEQVNLDKISAIAADELNKEQSDNSEKNISESNEQQPSDSTSQDTNGGEAKAINDVWLNIFETQARPQSTEEGQLLFGRILAGEIRNPGSYSMLTLKTLGELDQNMATLFKRLCSMCIAFENMDGRCILDARVPTLDYDPKRNGLSRYGLNSDQLNMLNEYGLIIPDYDSQLSSDLLWRLEGSRHLVFRHQGDYFGLSWQGSAVPSLLSIPLSGVGRELLRIVDQYPMPEYTEALKIFFAKHNLQVIETPIL